MTVAAQLRLDPPIDAAMPGLADAASPERMLDTCRRALTAVSDSVRDSWTNCLPTEAVYQPGRACRIAYALSTSDDEERPDLVYARWPAEARTHASAVRVPHAGGGFDLFRYPRDRRLRQVRAMRRQDWLRDASQVWASRRHGPGRFADDGWRCTPIKYVPESRLVCRLKGRWITAAGEQWVRAYVRISRRDDAERQLRLLAALERQLGALRSPLTVPNPLGAIPERHLLATEFVRGDTLRDAVRAGDRDAVERACAELARIAELDAAEASSGGPAAVSARAMLDDLLSAVELRGSVEALAPWARSRPRPPRTPRLIHGDLHAGQVILRKERMVLVDWERSRTGDPTQDAANLAAEIDARSLLGELTAAADDLPVAAVDAWRRAGAWNARSARWWTARAHVMRAWGLMRHLRPGWRDAAGRLLERAADVYAQGTDWTD